jgi:Zn finger protein HypA/HybF involved in hydrogenase expression
VLETFALRISVECHACRIAIPLNGVIPSALCYHCGETNAFDGEFWAGALPSDRFAEALELAPGATLETTRLQGGLRVEYAHRAPRCVRCEGGAVDLANIAVFAAHGSCACTACGQAIPVRSADAVCQAVNPGARFVINEQAPGAAGQSLQARTKPVVFQCMSCGGSLRVDGSKRLVACEFCKNDNYLPDGLWQILNPVPKPQTFFLVCEYESSAERAVRASVTTGGDALAVLAADPVPEVRRAVAANPATPPALLEKLAFDPSRRVLQGLAANPNLPSHIVDEMASSNDPEFRRLAASHPRRSPDPPPKLDGDSDEPDDRPPAKGFFSRLFGD